MIGLLIKFCLVGGSGVLVDFGITWLLKEKVKLNQYIANACGFLVAASTNYLLNRIWTFQSDNPEIHKEYLLFLAFSAIGLGLNTFLVWLFTEKVTLPIIGTRSAKLRFYSSKLIAISLVTLWNFFMNYFFTFNI